jgi:hypothetical protein
MDDARAYIKSNPVAPGEFGVTPNGIHYTQSQNSTVETGGRPNQSSTPQGDYNIQSPNGVVIANAIRNGEMDSYYSPVDKTTWKLDDSGNLVISYDDGRRLRGVVGGPDVDQSRPNATVDQNNLRPIGLTGQYNITTDKGLNAVNDLLIVAEYVRLSKKCVYECGFACVYMRYNCYINYFLFTHPLSPSL